MIKRFCMLFLMISFMISFLGTLSVHAIAVNTTLIDSVGVPKLLGNAINTKYDEINPFVSNDGKTLYFTRKYHPENVGGPSDPGDIWFSKRDENGQWSVAKNAGRIINNKLENKVAGLSKDNKTIWLSGQYKNGPNTFENPQGISVSTFQNNAWSMPKTQKIRFFNNKSNHLSQHVSAEGTLLLLSIESFETEGVEDLYICQKATNKRYDWSQPVNLGNMINTKFQEMTPFLSSDGISIFFSSNGYNGKGGRDIFHSKRLQDDWTHWSKPVNLTSLNTNGVELGFVFSENGEGYYSSTDNSKGYGDIYFVKWRKPQSSKDIPEVPVALDIEADTVQNTPFLPEISDLTDNQIHFRGTVRNELNQKPIVGALITITTNNQPSDKNKSITVKTDSLGGFNVILNKTSLLNIHISKKKFLVHVETLPLENVTGAYDIMLKPLEIGRTIALPAVLFQRGTNILLEESYNQLDQVIQTLLDNTNLKIELRGHTDGVGSGNANLILSQNRVDAVRKYMVDKGIDESRIIGKGYGGTIPLSDKKDEESRKLNRRVEFKILNI